MNVKRPFLGYLMNEAMIEMGSTTILVPHETLDSCLRVFFKDLPMDHPEEWIVCRDDLGKDEVSTVGRFIDDIKKHQPCWGFCRTDKNKIHYWIGPSANIYDVIGLFAHEFGHLEPLQEDSELRSEAYSRVSVRALCAAKEAMGLNWIQKQMEEK